MRRDQKLKLTYPNYKNSCGWNALLPESLPGQSVGNDIICDVAIIGAGYTGLAAARRWVEHTPGDSVVVLDSSDLGEGSPGRNSGFLLEISLANDAEPTAVDRMRTCNKMIAAAMADIVELVHRFDIQCNLTRSGTYRAAAGEEGLAALEAYVAFLKAAELPYERLDRAELQQRIGTDFYRAGLYSPHCYLAQPAALIRGMAANLPRSVALYQRSPALGVKRIGETWQVKTPHGNVTARTIIVANNAFAKNLGIGRSRVAAIYTYAALTEPLTRNLLEPLGSDHAWGLLPAHRLGSTLRRTADGRLLIRSCYDYESEADNDTVASILADALQRRFPFLGEICFAQVWGGATGLTLNGAPFWGEIDDNLYVSAGCNGGGVVKGTLFGGALSDLAHSKPVPDLQALFGSASWMPPDPLRRIGFEFISGLERRRGKAEI